MPARLSGTRTPPVGARDAAPMLLRAAPSAFAAILALAHAAFAAPARAQDGAPGVVLTIFAADDLAAHVRPIQRGATRALGAGRVFHRRARDEDCDPSEAGASCVATYLRGTRAAVLLVVHVHWARGGCVPLRREGRIVGRRMLRRRVADLVLLDAAGVELARSTVALGDDAGESAGLAEAATRSLFE